MLIFDPRPPRLGVLVREPEELVHEAQADAPVALALLFAAGRRGCGRRGGGGGTIAADFGNAPLAATARIIRVVASAS